MRTSYFQLTAMVLLGLSLSACLKQHPMQPNAAKRGLSEKPVLLQIFRGTSTYDKLTQLSVSQLDLDCDSKTRKVVATFKFSRKVGGHTSTVTSGTTCESTGPILSYHQPEGISHLEVGAPSFRARENYDVQMLSTELEKLISGLGKAKLARKNVESSKELTAKYLGMLQKDSVGKIYFECQDTDGRYKYFFSGNEATAARTKRLQTECKIAHQNFEVHVPPEDLFNPELSVIQYGEVPNSQIFSAVTEFALGYKPVLKF